MACSNPPSSSRGAKALWRIKSSSMREETNPVKLITEEEFLELLDSHGLRSEKVIEACRRVFVHGESRRGAAIACGVNYATLYRTVRRLQGLCPACGQALPQGQEVHE